MLAVTAISKLAREGDVAGIDPCCDRWAATLFERATKFTAWQFHIDDVTEKLAVSLLLDPRTRLQNAAADCFQDVP